MVPFIVHTSPIDQRSTILCTVLVPQLVPQMPPVRVAQWVYETLFVQPLCQISIPLKNLFFFFDSLYSYDARKTKLITEDGVL